MVLARLYLSLFILLFAGPALAAQEINWQEAVARLAQERTQAETCVRMLKKYGRGSAIGRGEVAYSEAKAEYDAIIAGLSVALARKEQPQSLPDLEDRLKRGFDKRRSFCNSVLMSIPSGGGPGGGEKGVVEQIVSGALGPLIQALQAIYMRAKDDDALSRATIQTQLEATSWPTFVSIAPPS